MNVLLAKPTAPFVGLRSFEPDDAEWFFGRERETADLARKVRRSGLTAVIGASGSGKSSLVRAGVLPGLVAEGFDPVIAKPGSAPLARLAEALAAAATPVGEIQEWMGDTRRFRFDAALRSSAFGLVEVARMVLAEKHRMVLVVDQFEEMFRYGDEAAGAARAAMREEGRAFVELLVTAAKQTSSRVHIVLTMRSDFFGSCTEYEGLAEAVSGAQYLVSPPGRDQLDLAIRRPLENVGAEIDESLVQRLLVDIEEETDRLPLLQHTLRRLWDLARGEARRLTETDYVSIGGLKGSIDRRAEQVVETLRRPGDLATLARTMKCLADLDEHDRATRRPQKRSEILAVLPGADPGGPAVEASLDRVVRALAAEDTSFLQVGDGSDPEIDIGHEALIRYWRRLAGDRLDFRGGWLREERTDGERWRGYVRRAEEGPLLASKELSGFRRWMGKRGLSPAWAARYGDGWEEVQSLWRRSMWGTRARWALVFISIAALAVWTGVSFFREVVTQRQMVQGTRLGALALAVSARQFAAAGDARLAAALARSALPPDLDSRSPHYVPEADAALGDALARPVEVLRIGRPGGQTYRVAFSPDGRRIASASSDKTVRVWDTATGRVATLRGHTDEVIGVAWSPNGQWVVSGSQDKTLRLWNAITGKQSGEPFEGHEGAVTSVAFSPDGLQIVSGSADMTLRRWDGVTGKPIEKVMVGHTGRILKVAWSPDGQRIASASEDKSLRLWDAKTGEPIGPPMEGHSEGTIGVAWSPDSQRIVSASGDKTLRIWDAATRQAVGSPLSGHTGAVFDVAFSLDGRRIVSGSTDETVRLWNPVNGQPIGTPLTGHDDAVIGVAFSPDGSQVASGSADGTTRLWSTKITGSAGVSLQGDVGPTKSIALSPDGRVAASGAEDGTVQLWSTGTGGALGGALRGHRGAISALAFAPDGRRLVSASADHDLRIWDVDTAQLVGLELTGHTGEVTSVAFSPDGSQIVSGSADGRLLWWDSRTGQRIGDEARQPSPVTSVTFSPDGRRLFSGSDDALRQWDAASHQLIAEITAVDSTSATAFSPDGRWLVCGSRQKTLIILDVATGERVTAPRQGHTDQVTSVAFSPDGRRIVSASRDATLRIWDAVTGQPIGAPLQGHTGPVGVAAFSADGQQIVSASLDNESRVWDAVPFTRKLPELAAAADALCPLSGQERQKYGLFDPLYPHAEKEWTAAQSKACGAWPER